MKRKSSKKTIICKVIAAFVAGIFSIFMAQRYSKADEPYVNLEYFKEYHEVRKLNGYTFTLTHGIFSEKTRTGCCVFEVEKDNGVMTMPEVVWDDNGRIDYFNDYYGDSSISLMPMHSGYTNIRAKIKGGKMIAYVDFQVDRKPPEATEDYEDNHIFLFAGGYPLETLERDYSFRFENNTGGKEYQVDDFTKLCLSYFGLSVESDHILKNLKVELKDEKGKTKTFDFTSSKADIKGHYGGSSQRDGGYSRISYSYTFNKINYDIIDETKEIYVNGKKLTD